MPSPQIKIVDANAIKKQRRRQRRPQHPFAVKGRPFEIVPFMVAPVLPGETLESLLLQSRVVTDPIKHPLIGWWHEFYYFYVPFRAFDMNNNSIFSTSDDALALTQLMLDPTADISEYRATAAADSVPYYSFKGGINFTYILLTVITQNYFRDEEEQTWDTGAYWDDYPLAHASPPGWMQSLKLESATGDDTELPGVDEQEELDILPGFTNAYAQWEIMRDAGYTDLTYEDFIKSYGVSVPKVEDEGYVGQGSKRKFFPELIRFVRKWSYPTNHVEPTTGVPTSAVSWSIQERADKSRLFKEPGFIFGVTITRPKIYFKAQKGAAVGLLDSPYRWLPATLQGVPYTSVTEVLDSTTDGILRSGAGGPAEDYWLDTKDLFLYGDQFVNFAQSEAANHGFSLPTATMNKYYPLESEMNAIFATTDGTKSYIRQDGITHLNIMGRLSETTPGD